MPDKTGGNVGPVFNVSIFIYFLLIFFGFLSYNTSILDYTLLPRFLICSIFLVGLLALCVVKARQIPYSNLMVCSFGAYLLWHLASCTWAINLAEALFSVEKILIGCVVLIFTLFFFIENTNFEVNLIRLLCLITSISLILGIYQLLQIPLDGFKNPYQVESICGHKNLFASFIFAMFFFNFYCCIKLSGIWKVWGGMNAFLCLFFIVILQTRAVWVGSLVALVFYSLVIIGKPSLRPRFGRNRLMILTAVVMAIVSVTTILFLYQSKDFLERANVFNFSKSPAGAERLIIWEQTLKIIHSNLFFGIGAGNWQVEFPKFGIVKLPNVEYNNITFQRPHNDLLWIWAETGLIGIFLYILIHATLLFRIIKCVKEHKAAWQLTFFLTAYVGWITISVFDFPKERIEHTLITSLLLAFIWHYSGVQKDQITHNSRNNLLSILLMMMLCFTIYTGIRRWQGELHTKSMYHHRTRQNWNKVIREVDKAHSFFYSLDPTTVPLQWYRGTANFSEGRMNESLHDFLLAKEEAPYNHYVLNNLGSAYEMNGNSTEAKKYYRQAIEISPHFDDAKLNLAAVLYNEHNYKEALELVTSTSRDTARKEEYLQILQRKISF